MRPMKYLQPLRYFRAMIYFHTRYIIYIHIFIYPYIHIYRSVLRRKLMLPVISQSSIDKKKLHHLHTLIYTVVCLTLDILLGIIKCTPSTFASTYMNTM